MLEISAFKKLLDSQKCWLLDGATGTELERRGVFTQLPFWTALAVEEHPGILSDIHKEYLSAGCQILTANTFRISWYLFEKHRQEDKFFPLLRKTCELARSVLPINSGVLLAASITTLEDCYRPDLVPDESTLLKYHRSQLEALDTCPVDFILAETINSIKEAAVIMQLCAEMKLPLILSFVTNGEGELLSAEKIIDLLKIAEQFSPIGMSINCGPVPEILNDAIILAGHFEGVKGIYANAPGKPHPDHGWEAANNACPVLEHFAGEMIDLHFKIIGGCCGTTPEMLHAIQNRTILHT